MTIFSQLLADLQAFADMADKWEQAQAQCTAAGERMSMTYLLLFPTLRITLEHGRISKLFELEGMSWQNEKSFDMEAVLANESISIIWRMPGDRFFCYAHET